MIKINWKTPENESPILFKNQAKWTGFDIRHWRVSAGELIEQTFSAHDVKITLAGSVVTQTHTASGAWRTSREEVGSVCLTPAGQPIKAAWETEIECLSITFSPTFVAQTALEQNFSAPLELLETHGRRDPLIQHIALGLLTEANGCEPMGRMYAESLAQTLILHLLKNYSTSKSVRENSTGGLSGFKLRRAKEFIGEHLEEDLTLGRVAEAVGFSQFHFARAFRRSTGLTPQQYLVQQRIMRAKELLIKGELPLVEVGIYAGFKNQSHFTTLFRKFTALTPKAFREAKHQ